GLGGAALRDVHRQRVVREIVRTVPFAAPIFAGHRACRKVGHLDVDVPTFATSAAALLDVLRGDPRPLGDRNLRLRLRRRGDTAVADAGVHTLGVLCPDSYPQRLVISLDRRAATAVGGLPATIVHLDLHLGDLASV